MYKISEKRTLLDGMYEVIPVTVLADGYVTEVQIKDNATGELIALSPDVKEEEIFDVSERGSLGAIEDILDMAQQIKEKEGGV